MGDPNVKKIPGLENGANPLSYGNIGKGIDQKTTTFNGALRNIVEDFFTEDVLEGVSEFVGQVYRVTDSDENTSNESPYVRSLLKSLVKKYKVCKVRAFDLDVMKIIPSSFDDPNAPTYKQDQVIIDTYKDYVFVPEAGDNTPIAVGDIVVVTYGNLKTYQDGKIVRKLSSGSDGQGSVTPVGASAPKDETKKAFGEKQEASQGSAASAPSTTPASGPISTGGVGELTAEQVAAVQNVYTAVTPMKAPKGNPIEICKALKDRGITNKYALVAIIGNIEKESGLRLVTEDLTYKSLDRIKFVFSGNVRYRKSTDEYLTSLLNKQNLIAEWAYGLGSSANSPRGGLGNKAPGDGWKYRGRGFIGITGLGLYSKYAKILNVDLIGNPELINQDVRVASSVVAEYMKMTVGSKINSFANQDEANRKVTQAIGGRGLNLDVGIGAEILGKVNKFAPKYEDIVNKVLRGEV